MSEVWDLITIGWDRIDHKEPGLSSDDVNAFERTRGVVLPDAVRWLDTQPFLLRRQFAFWYAPFSRSNYDDNGRAEYVWSHAPSTSRRVALAEPVRHHWSSAIERGYVPGGFASWVDLMVVIAVDDFRNTYVLDFNFDAEHPPVLYCNWSEGTWLGDGAGLGYVADRFEDYLQLPEWDGERASFRPQRPARLDEWKAWLLERIDALRSVEDDETFLYP